MEVCAAGNSVLSSNEVHDVLNINNNDQHTCSIESPSSMFSPAVLEPCRSSTFSSNQLANESLSESLIVNSSSNACLPERLPSSTQAASDESIEPKSISSDHQPEADHTIDNDPAGISLEHEHATIDSKSTLGIPLASSDSSDESNRMSILSSTSNVSPAAPALVPSESLKHLPVCNSFTATFHWLFHQHSSLIKEFICIQAAMISKNRPSGNAPIHKNRIAINTLESALNLTAFRVSSFPKTFVSAIYVCQHQDFSRTRDLSQFLELTEFTNRCQEIIQEISTTLNKPDAKSQIKSISVAYELNESACHLCPGSIPWNKAAKVSAGTAPKKTRVSKLRPTSSALAVPSVSFSSAPKNPPDCHDSSSSASSSNPSLNSLQSAIMASSPLISSLASSRSSPYFATSSSATLNQLAESSHQELWSPFADPNFPFLNVAAALLNQHLNALCEETQRLSSDTAKRIQILSSTQQHMAQLPNFQLQLHAAFSPHHVSSPPDPNLTSQMSMTSAGASIRPQIDSTSQPLATPIRNGSFNDISTSRPSGTTCTGLARKMPYSIDELEPGCSNNSAGNSKRYRFSD